MEGISLQGHGHHLCLAYEVWVLTCGEGGGDEAAPHGVLGSLQAHGVLSGLRKTLQADPRVLSIHNQLLYTNRCQEQQMRKMMGSLKSKRRGKGSHKLLQPLAEGVAWLLTALG